MTQEEKTQAVQDYFSSQVDTLDLGITVTVEYDDDPDYPDDYYITLAKDGSESPPTSPCTSAQRLKSIFPTSRGRGMLPRLFFQRSDF